MYELKYSNTDSNRVFARLAWSNKTLMFTWSIFQKAYVYCSMANGEIRFKPGGYTHTYSLVGEGVLAQEDIVELDKITKEIKMAPVKKTNNKNYTGNYNEVVTVTYQISDNEPVFDCYNFKTSIPGLKEGDIVIVDDHNGYNITRVLEVHTRGLDNKSVEAFNQAKAWVVDKVNTEFQEHRKKVTQRREFILTQLEEKKAAMEEVAIYTMLAEKDPEAAKLLEELKGL